MTNLVSVQLLQNSDYQFTNIYDGKTQNLVTDEPPPLGSGLGPSPIELLCSAVGNCLCASLLFAFRKFKGDPGKITANIQAEVGRNENARVRVLKINANITLENSGPELTHLHKILEQFEEFCTVTQSVRSSIPVHLKVFNQSSVILHSSE